MSQLEFSLGVRTPVFSNDVTSESIGCLALNPHVKETLCCASLEGSIGVFDAARGCPLTTWKPHRSAITDITFSQSDPSLLFSSSRDGFAKLSDCRLDPSSRTICQIKSSLDDGGAEMWSLSSGGTAEQYLACSIDHTIRLYDVRFLLSTVSSRHTGRRQASRGAGHVWTFDSSHSDVINVVRFHPTRRNLLISGADDDLVVIHDVNRCGQSNNRSTTFPSEDTEDVDDPSVVGGINNTSPPRLICFAGPSLNTVCVVSTIETLCAWHCDEMGSNTLQATQRELSRCNESFLTSGDHQKDYAMQPIKLPATSLQQAPELMHNSSFGYIANLVYDQFAQRLYAIAGNLMLFGLKLMLHKTLNFRVYQRTPPVLPYKR